MDFDKLFEIEPTEIIKMDKDKFFKKTQELLNKISFTYATNWKSRTLLDSEYPNEDVCEKCNGCGTFLNNDKEKVDCVADYEQGDCYARYFDAEEFADDFDGLIVDVDELNGVDGVF